MVYMYRFHPYPFPYPYRYLILIFRALKAAVEKEAAVPSYSPEELGLTPLKKRDKLRPGEKVVVCSGSSLGWEGEVVSVREREPCLVLCLGACLI